MKEDVRRQPDPGMPAAGPVKVGLSVPAGDIYYKEVYVRDLPLYIVITCQVIDVDLPRKEFTGEEEFEEYLRRYAGQRLAAPAAREKFIKSHLDRALYIEDEIVGDRAWQLGGAVKHKYARACGFGILKTQSKQYYIFQTVLGPDLPSQLAAYQALTCGAVSREFLPLFASRERRERTRSLLGDALYAAVAGALGIAGL